MRELHSVGLAFSRLHCYDTEKSVSGNQVGFDKSPTEWGVSQPFPLLNLHIFFELAEDSSWVGGTLVASCSSSLYESGSDKGKKTAKMKTNSSSIATEIRAFGKSAAHSANKKISSLMPLGEECSDEDARRKRDMRDRINNLLGSAVAATRTVASVAADIPQALINNNPCMAFVAIEDDYCSISSGSEKRGRRRGGRNSRGRRKGRRGSKEKPASEARDVSNISRRDLIMDNISISSEENFYYSSDEEDSCTESMLMRAASAKAKRRQKQLVQLKSKESFASSAAASGYESDEDRGFSMGYDDPRVQPPLDLPYPFPSQELRHKDCKLPSQELRREDLAFPIDDDPFEFDKVEWSPNMAAAGVALPETVDTLNEAPPLESAAMPQLQSPPRCRRIGSMHEKEIKLLPHSPFEESTFLKTGFLGHVVQSTPHFGLETVLQLDDVLVKLNGEDVSNLFAEEVHRRLHDMVGEVVRVSFLRRALTI